VTYTGLPQEEIERRYRLVREAMDEHGVDAVIVAGNEYTGFEGAVTYLSGFVIVHRYAYVLLPRDGAPSIVFPSEARYVGEHGTTWIEDQVFVDLPGAWLAERCRGKRVGVYGLDYVMTVRDYRALAEQADVVPFDVEFDHARMVKSELELESVRESVRINTEGFWIFLEHFEPGKSEREVLAPCERYFVEQGCGRWTWCWTGRTAPRSRSSRSPATASLRVPTACFPRSRSRARAATGSRSPARSARRSRARTRGG
jgi:Xaa-Pro aminopeptidase